MIQLAGARHPSIATTGIQWNDGKKQPLHSPGRPQLSFDKGSPSVPPFGADDVTRRDRLFNIRVAMKPARTD